MNRKILIMVHNLTGGGAERVASLWARGFAERGYEVGIVLNCGKDTPITYKVPEQVMMYNLAGHPWVNYLANKMHRRLYIDTYYVRRLRRILKDFQPNVAIGVLQPYAEWARKASKGMNIKIINTEHNPFERPEGALYSPMDSQRYKEKYVLNKYYDYVTVLTEADKKCVQNILTNVSVLPNPLTYIPIEVFPHKDKIILAAGRLDAWYVKGFDVLIKAWGSIAPKYTDWKLQIAGDSKKNGYKYLKSIVDDLNIKDSVEFLGFQPNMLFVYQRASIFVLSSRYEGFGMVLIEAMSQGCAPIACDYKGRQREIITCDREGLLCEPDNPKALAESIEKMIVNEEYRQNVQSNAIERSKYYSLDKTMDRWDEIIKQVRI